MELPDIHSETANIPISIRKVGVMGVRLPGGYVTVGKSHVQIQPILDVFIDLPANQKGIHGSRNYEIIPEALNAQTGKSYHLQDVCAILARELLEAHEYATRSEVRARGDIVVEKTSPVTEKTSYEAYKLTAAAVALRGLGKQVTLRKTVGVGVTGITACPCGLELLRDFAEEKLSRNPGLSREMAKQIVSEVPIATHMQRSHGQISVETLGDSQMDIEMLTKVIENSMSSMTYSLLKRADEAAIIKHAVANTRFAEDCIRHMMKNFAETFPELSDNAVIAFRIRSQESIHKYDFTAERTITLGELRQGLNGKT